MVLTRPSPRSTPTALSAPDQAGKPCGTRRAEGGILLGLAEQCPRSIRTGNGVGWPFHRQVRPLDSGALYQASSSLRSPGLASLGHERPPAMAADDQPLVGQGG